MRIELENNASHHVTCRELRKAAVNLIGWALVGVLLSSPPVLAADAKKGGRSAPVVIAKASIRELAPVTWVSGTVISRNDAKLATEVDGNLIHVADVGDFVKKGDVLARIDETIIKLRVDELRASVDKAQAQLDFYKSELVRLRRLAKQNNAAQTQLEQTEADRKIGENDLSIANSRLLQAREELIRHVIRAPFSGVVSERLKQPGERANAGDQILRLVDPNRVEIRAIAPLSAVNFVDTGNNVNVTSDTNADSKGQARIRALVPVGNERTRMVDLRLSFRDIKWRVGQSVKVALPTAKPRQVLAVPRDALVLRRDGSSLFRLSSNDTAEKISVDVGIAVGNLVEVKGDLNDGDRVVVRGGERLRNGQAVTILKAVSESI